MICSSSQTDAGPHSYSALGTSTAGNLDSEIQTVFIQVVWFRSKWIHLQLQYNFSSTPTCFYFWIINQSIVFKRHRVNNCVLLSKPLTKRLYLDNVLILTMYNNEFKFPVKSHSHKKRHNARSICLIRSAPALQQKMKHSDCDKSNLIKCAELSAKKHKQVLQREAGFTTLCGRQRSRHDLIRILNQTKQTRTDWGGPLHLSRINRQIWTLEWGLMRWIIWFTATAPAKVKLTDCDLVLVNVYLPHRSFISFLSVSTNRNYSKCFRKCIFFYYKLYSKHI